jgi:hypothetical protein
MQPWRHTSRASFKKNSRSIKKLPDHENIMNVSHSPLIRMQALYKALKAKETRDTLEEHVFRLLKDSHTDRHRSLESLRKDLKENTEIRKKILGDDLYQFNKMISFFERDHRKRTPRAFRKESSIASKRKYHVPKFT